MNPRPDGSGTLRAPRALGATIVVAVIALLVGLCFFVALHDWSDFAPVGGGSAHRRPAAAASRALPPAVDPVSDPAALRDVSREDAVKLNADIPIAATPNPAARGLSIPIGDGQSFLRALDCMTAAVHYEAASETDDGMRAVAQVVLNRLRNPNFPNTVCGVVFQGSERRTGCQFSFTCDGSMARVPVPAAWARARRIASEALAGRIFAPVGWSTHYHADYVAPYWAPTLVKTAVIGVHIFYRWPQQWGAPRAFTQAYGGVEPTRDEMAERAALPADNGSAVPGAVVDVAARPILSITGQVSGDVVPGRKPLVDRAGGTPAPAPAASAPPVAIQSLSMSGTRQEAPPPAKP